MRKYLVIYEKTGTGYSAYVPDLPGCIASGESKEIVEGLIYDAIQLHIEALTEANLSIPEGSTESEVLVFN